jgi:hypothetical protein
MSLSLFPPEDLVQKMVPILCRVVGIFFIVGGILESLLVPVLFLGEVENIAILGLFLFIGAVFSVGTGIIVMKYMPKFTLTLHQKLRENPPF